MRKEKKKKNNNKYLAEYTSDELKLKLEKGVSLRVNLKDNLEVGVFLAKFRQAGLGSSRELGSLFRRSASTVINKQRSSRLGSKRLVDGRRQKTRYKLEELKAEILLIWVKRSQASDKDMLEQLEPRLSALGMRLDLRSLKRHLKQTGIEEARSRLRTEDILTNEATAVAKDNHAQNNTTSGLAAQNKSREKQITQTSSRYAGQMLHLPQLCRIGFSEMVKVLPSSQDCLYSKEKLSYQLYFLYAIGLKRVYGLDSLDHPSFGALIAEEDNLRSSGMNKRIERIAQVPKTTELLQEKALAGRAELINRKDAELLYTDTHVIEVWVNKAIAMAKHGTKNKKVKAINVHYLIGSDSATPIVKEYSSGNKRLHWAIPRLLEKADQGLKQQGKRLKIICFDKGGVSLETLKSIAAKGKAFLCWGKRTAYVKKQIARIRQNRFKHRREKEICQNGKLMRVVERLADATTCLRGWGKMRTIVVELPEEEGGGRLWMYTNLKRNRYDCLQLRQMMRYKQRQENFFRARKYRSALDCFAGGRCRIKPLSRPSEKALELLKKQFKRQEKSIEKDQDNLIEVKELKSHRLLKPDLARRETDYLSRRIKQNIEQKEKTEEKIRWAEGGRRPRFIKQPFQLELNKQKLLNEFQDLMLLAKRESIKEFLDCYQNVLKKEGYGYQETTQRMKYLDKVAIEKELFNLGGIIIHDKTEKKITIQLKSQGREYFKKALVIFLHQLNKKKTKVDYGNKQRYRLYFCLAPPG